MSHAHAPAVAMERPAGTGAHRVIFVDLARAFAVVFMIQGHSLDALLAPLYRQGAIYDAWLFLRGLTSCLFLTLSGFAFSVATARHWAAHTRLTQTVVRRLRRFGFFILLGYALHVPVSHLWDLATLDRGGWQSFLAADVLQTIGLSLVTLQGLVYLTRSPRVFTGATITLTTLIVVATPAVWRVAWAQRLPLAIAAYLSPATGSTFPLFPWMAFPLMGAALGQVYAHWGAAHLGTYEKGVLLPVGTAMVVIGTLLAQLPYQVLGPTEFWRNSPNLFLIRAGCVLLILAGMAHLSRRLPRVPRLVGAVAQESLIIYFLHLCLVYGSPWNPGLRQWFGATLGPLGVTIVILLVVAGMIAVAGVWNWVKHARRRAATGTRWVAGATLLLGLL